jgi:mono/diheme cytochrome c family protein
MGFRYDGKLKCMVAAGAILAWFGLSNCTGLIHADERDAQYAKKGRALFVQYCVSCHGSAAKGDGPAATALKLRPSDLTNMAQEYNGFPSDKVANYIDGEKATSAHGSREMPVWGKRFRDAQRGEAAALGEVYALTKYLQSIQKK